jgi:hypothetical protein
VWYLRPGRIIEIGVDTLKQARYSKRQKWLLQKKDTTREVRGWVESKIPSNPVAPYS